MQDLESLELSSQELRRKLEEMKKTRGLAVDPITPATSQVLDGIADEFGQVTGRKKEGPS